MPQYTVLVIGDHATLVEHTRRAWLDAGVVLEGPVLPDHVDMARLRDWVGVLVDIAGFSDALMAALETFDTMKAPYVFVVTETPPAEGPQPFILGPHAGDIQTLLNALLAEGRARPGRAPQPLS